jgi:dienelactone hydrolase
MGRLVRSLLCVALSGALAGGLAAAPTAGAAGATDPTRPGPRSVTLLPYDEGPAVLAVAPAGGAPQPVDVRGELHVPSGSGRLPVVVLLHGRHGTCRYLVTESLGHPCPDTPVTSSVRSYQGYRYLASSLASHGYLVASIDANGINTFDTAAVDSGAVARAELVSRTLDLLGSWGAGEGTHGAALRGRVDLTRIGLMGHSRGGEGVTRWLTYNRERTDGPRYPVSGVLALAPTDFDDHVVTDATPYAVVLPRCDGDVFDLQGADVFERSQYVAQGPLHQLTVEGANHNFFNSVWTGDDIAGTSDRNCRADGGRRLTAPQQERVGLALMAAFFRRYVGGERAVEPLLTGRARPTWPCSPGLAMACRDLLDVSWQPGPRGRTTLLVPGVAGTALSTPGARLVPGPGLEVEGCVATACPAQGRNSDPNRSGGPQAALSWERPTSLQLVASTSWRGDPGGDLVLRLGVNAEADEHVLGTGRLRLRVQLTDTRGRSRTVSVTAAHGAPEPPPGDLVRNLLLSDVRVPLGAFRGVDVTRVRSVRLLLDDPSGSAQLADVALQR